MPFEGGLERYTLPRRCDACLWAAMQEQKQETTVTAQLVRFFMAPRYFDGVSSQGMNAHRYQQVCREAFGNATGEVFIAASREHRQGFHVILPAELFARFIVARSQLGQCVNGVKDLNPEFINPPQKKSIRGEVSRSSGVDGEVVARVIQHYREVCQAAGVNYVLPSVNQVIDTRLPDATITILEVK